MARPRRTIPPTGTESAFMRKALQLARDAAASDEIPVGAIVLGPHGEVLGAAHNAREIGQDPTAHAEVLAIREAAAARGTRILDDCTLVVTLEPCLMCAGVILAARLSRVVFGAWDEKAGAVGSVYDVLRDGRLPSPVPEVVAGVEEAACAQLLRDYFQKKRT